MKYEAERLIQKSWSNAEGFAKWNIPAYVCPECRFLMSQRITEIKFKMAAWKTGSVFRGL